MKRALALGAILALAARARGDDAAVAEALYDQARQLVTEGKLAEACPKFAASFKADAQLGVLLNLADCNEKLGKTATAWVQFRDAVERAGKQSDKRVDYAQKRVDALASKLDRLTIAPPAVAVPGLVVKLDDTDVTALLGGETPVDPGQHSLVASAPGHAPWQTTVKIDGEGNRASVQIGELALAKPTESSAPAAPRRGVLLRIELDFPGYPVTESGMFYCHARGPLIAVGVQIVPHLWAKVAAGTSGSCGSEESIGLEARATAFRYVQGFIGAEGAFGGFSLALPSGMNGTAGLGVHLRAGIGGEYGRFGLAFVGAYELFENASWFVIGGVLSVQFKL